MSLFKMPASKKGDMVFSIDLHKVITPTGVIIILPHVFWGTVKDSLAKNVRVNKKKAEIVGSISHNNMPHFPTPPGVMFAPPPPSNKGKLKNSLNNSVRANKKFMGSIVRDRHFTCNEIKVATGIVTGFSNVIV